MVERYLGGRVVASRRTGLLAAGDLLALAVFVAASAARHGTDPASMAQTALEFGLGWALVATLAGAYGERALAGRGRAVLLGAGAWALGAVVGALLRFVLEPGATIAPIFVLVTAGVGAIIFGAWRGIAAGHL